MEADESVDRESEFMTALHAHYGAQELGHALAPDAAAHPARRAAVGGRSG